MNAGAELAEIAFCIGDPSRASMLWSLMGRKKARPASELAMLANVSPQTASNHLKTLVNARLLKVSPMGRNKFYRLSDASVAAALESLMVVARPEIKAGGIAERTAPWPKGAHPKEAAVEEKRVATTDLWFKSLGRT